MTESMIVAVFLFILGACIGSFLNVCIVRLPLEQSIVRPRSHCMACQKMIPWHDNIPLISYLFLRGKCRFCGVKFSMRYWLVEMLTGATFVVFYYAFGPTLLMTAYLVMMCGFIVATFVDFGHRIIPDEVSVGGVYLGLLLSAWIPEMHIETLAVVAAGRVLMWMLVGLLALCFLWEFVIARRPIEKEDMMFFIFVAVLLVLELILQFLRARMGASLGKALPYVASVDNSIIGMFVGGGLIYAMGILGDILFRKESMGGGDVKLMAMVGAFLGWKLAVLAFFIAPIFGAIFGIAEKIRTGDTTIAYGPFLVLGAIISLFWGEPIILWIMHGYRIY